MSSQNVYLTQKKRIFTKYALLGGNMVSLVVLCVARWRSLRA